jgi:hypothetical protein
MKETFELLLKNWSQFSVLFITFVGGSGFLLKLYFNWSIRKKEITYNKIRESKIQELRAFYKSYVNLEIHLRGLHHATSVNNQQLEDKLYEKMPELWNQFYFDFTFLKIFLTTSETKVFEELSEELDNIQKNIDFYQIDREFKTVDNNTVKQLRFIRDEVFPKRIPALLKTIEMNLKKDFNIK